MILEGIVTTVNKDRSINVSPMGPVVDGDISKLVLRPYQTSTTYQNLKRDKEGVFHVTDDVMLLAQAAVGTPDPVPEFVPTPVGDGHILADACRWYLFRVVSLDDRQERTEIECDVVAQGRQRDFLGFNRAKHAVLEAAILATRLEFIPADEIERDFERLAVIIEKTAGSQELEAFAFLKEHVRRCKV